MRPPALLLGFALLLLTEPQARGELTAIREGAWEITIAPEVPGVPLEMPSITEIQCLSRERPVPLPPGKDLHCTQLRTALKGDMLVWELACNDGEVAVTGEVRYRNERLSGRMVIDAEDPEHGLMSVAYALTGKHAGPCPRGGRKGGLLSPH